MIPFEEIDSRLEKLKKDRVWLAENTPYSADYIRTVLAPKSTRRTARVQQVLSDAIEKEEQFPVDKGPPRLDYISVEVAGQVMDRYIEAAKIARLGLKEWVVQELNRAAAAWFLERKHSQLSPVVPPADENQDTGTQGK